MDVFPKTEDKLLISLLKKGEVKAFDTLFHKYKNKLYHFSFSVLKSEEDSKEIVQETFYRIWKKRFEIDSSKSFKSFLFTISYNLIIDQLRFRLKEKEYRKFLVYYFESNENKEEKGKDFETLTKKIETAVEELPEKRRRIFKLSRERGFSHKEIASCLGITTKTVENQINLSLRHIKLKVGQNDYFPF